MYKLPDDIFITGYAGSGKDTLGQTLVERAGFTRLAFADALKEEVAEYLGITVPELNARKAEFRTLLQEWGTMRGVEKHYWIEQWRLRRERIAGPVVCTDLRFPHEAFFALESGGLLLRVSVPEEERIARLMARDGRYDPAWADHPSEKYVRELPVHADVPGNLPEDARLPTIEAVYVSLLTLREEMGDGYAVQR